MASILPRPISTQISCNLSRSESGAFALWSTNVDEFVLCSAVIVALALRMFQPPTQPPGHPHRTGSFRTFAAMENPILAARRSE
ncbi:uncharacterized protein LY79DRAFT_409325 [Colletotrichum navitas]|uniref:Uncharacterized protein n=1 Tax=Colletotrichum navitas TaxID=681940 RepID=A0AAD8V9H4_9PEZI|nr:uncharacterized protein LY79DRAFT_409325 [Colletotrichum navitas]KAK1597243.1 hypothetical protein LY79DRAFT_409325 [Colletotrichum navitas]